MFICSPAKAFKCHGHIKSPHPEEADTLLASTPLPTSTRTLSCDNWQQYGAGITTKTITWTVKNIATHHTWWNIQQFTAYVNIIVYCFLISESHQTWGWQITHLVHRYNVLGGSCSIPGDKNSWDPNVQLNPRIHALRHYRPVDPSKVHLILAWHCCRK